MEVDLIESKLWSLGLLQNKGQKYHQTAEGIQNINFTDCLLNRISRQIIDNNSWLLLNIMY